MLAPHLLVWLAVAAGRFFEPRRLGTASHEKALWKGERITPLVSACCHTNVMQDGTVAD